MQEIDRVFYCAAYGLDSLCNFCKHENGDCENCDEIREKVCILNSGDTSLLQGCMTSCALRHRKWPTPEQFKEEYGEDYPDDAAVYVWLEPNTYGWGVMKKRELRLNPTAKYIVCACTPWGKPPDGWRPE